MATTDTSQDSVIKYRREVFKEMGFTDMQAGVLANARDSRGWYVCSHKVRKAVVAGCPRELAMRIFQ